MSLIEIPQIQNIALVIEYDGSKFYGFQKQITGVLTVQDELEKALSKFAQHKITTITAGRTDTGVHALFQVVNFKTHITRPLHNWQRGVNSLLHRSIVIHEIIRVSDDFNARFCALSRTYHYYLSLNKARPAILLGKVGFYTQPLDIEKMCQALNYLIGTQDFSSFRASNCQAANPIRSLTEAVLIVKNDILCFKLTANAFLYHMVRNIIGALIYVGNGKLSVDDFKQLIALKNRTKAPPTFMPDGLYLAGVKYQSPLFNYDVPMWFV